MTEPATAAVLRQRAALRRLRYEDGDNLIDPVVYFIQSGACGPIKIGYARDTYKRLNNLQAGNPVELTYLGDIPGGLEVEQGLHQEFKADRIRGEWFAPTARLIGRIQELLAAAAPVKRANSNARLFAVAEAMSFSPRSTRPGPVDASPAHGSGPASN